MSTITIASVPRITSTELSTLLLRQQQQQQQQQTPTPPQSLSIIDVRTTDHIGGHIITSTHVPATSLDHRIPALVRDLKDKKTVVFHCALSHQRGPGAAVQYLRERRRVLGEEKEGEEEQKVLVLDGGFVQWQEKYMKGGLIGGAVALFCRFGKDERLTEGYVEDIWAEGYSGH